MLHVPAEPAGPAPDAGTVLDEVRRIVAEVIGDEVDAADIDLDTRFRDDLDVESIEFVALGEALQARFGERVRLAQWIADMEVDEIIDMTVGQLVDHVAGSLR